jgi:Xaa-Pro dipeptidase
MNPAGPKLSLKERDRRWKFTREAMKQNGLDCLIVAGLIARDQLDGYYTNDYAQGMVVFPREEEPTYLVGGSTRLTRHMELLKREGVSWMMDYRAGTTGPGIVALLKERGFTDKNIGLVGVDSNVPYGTWAYVVKQLPKTNFVDFTSVLVELMWVKSAEEIALLRHASKIGEMACQAMIDTTKPGVSEVKIYAAIMNVINENAAGTPIPPLILHSGVDNASWGPPMWTFQATDPHIIQPGDIVQAELFPRYGGLEAQQQMSIGISPVSEVNQECARLARKAYDIGIKELKPGKTFREVAEAMEVPIVEAGCWHPTPLIHGLNPMASILSPGSTGGGGLHQMPGIEKYKILKIPPAPAKPQKDIVIKAGMAFELEPNACRGLHRINIGGTVLVNENGVEELNKLASRTKFV